MSKTPLLAVEVVAMANVYWQTNLNIPAMPRGFHIITPLAYDALTDMPGIQTGLLNLFIQHTSVSLTISENTCQDVQTDLESFYNHIAPDDNRLYTHTLEGEDDMPAHIKNSLLGASINIPIQDNKLCLGQWQGIYLCEHRNQAPSRKIILTVSGKEL
jgi:secondary thiamine-phosphate synthase enzyme